MTVTFPQYLGMMTPQSLKRILEIETGMRSKSYISPRDTYHRIGPVRVYLFRSSFEGCLAELLARESFLLSSTFETPGWVEAIMLTSWKREISKEADRRADYS